MVVKWRFERGGFWNWPIREGTFVRFSLDFRAFFTTARFPPRGGLNFVEFRFSGRAFKFLMIEVFWVGKSWKN